LTSFITKKAQIFGNYPLMSYEWKKQGALPEGPRVKNQEPRAKMCTYMCVFIFNEKVLSEILIPRRDQEGHLGTFYNFTIFWFLEFGFWFFKNENVC